jgi:hypothetical protein
MQPLQAREIPILRIGQPQWPRNNTNWYWRESPQHQNQSTQNLLQHQQQQQQQREEEEEEEEVVVVVVEEEQMHQKTRRAKKRRLRQYRKHQHQV